MANLYLVESLRHAALGDIVVVSGQEARHAATVSRTRVGDAIAVGNGAGLVVDGVVRTADASQLTLEVESVTTTEARTPALWLAQALAKGGRDEAAIQTATELGVDGVIPWAASRSIVRWDGAKVAKGDERWRAIVREAAKQSMRAWLPEVAPLVTTTRLATLGRSSRLLVLDPMGDLPLTALDPADDEREGAESEDSVVIVGPEGGISPQELDSLGAAGARRVRLGDTILRTSSAGPAALAVLNAQLGRW
ncbi:MAG: hypothetical protein RI885_1618 [Actinomycetota bacterium]